MTVLRRLGADSYVPRRASIVVIGMYALLAISVGLLVMFVAQWRNAINDGTAFQRDSADPANKKRPLSHERHPYLIDGETDNFQCYGYVNHLRAYR